jgi:hypothetical protein
MLRDVEYCEKSEIVFEETIEAYCTLLVILSNLQPQHSHRFLGVRNSSVFPEVHCTHRILIQMSQFILGMVHVRTTTIHIYTTSRQLATYSLPISHPHFFCDPPLSDTLQVQ